MHKIIIIEKNPYLISDEEIQLGDVAMVTVGNNYPSKVVCENETVLELIKNPKLTLTKSYKLVGDSDKIKLPEDRINNIIENGGICDVLINGEEIKFITI